MYYHEAQLHPTKKGTHYYDKHWCDDHGQRGLQEVKVQRRQAARPLACLLAKIQSIITQKMRCSFGQKKLDKISPRVHTVQIEVGLTILVNI